MSWTWSGTPGTATAAERRDKVRELIGDTDTTDQQVTDEQIAAWLASYSDDTIRAALYGCQVLVAKYSRQADKTMGKTKIAASQRAQAYRELAKSIKANLGGGTQMIVGGISVSGKEDLTTDEDAVQPTFSIGMDDYPGAA